MSTSGLFVAAAFLAGASGGEAEYTVTDFFIDAPLEYITGIETMTATEKDGIIESGFASDEPPFTAFSVFTCEPDRLQMRDIDIHLYPMDGGGYVVSVTSILGDHGENHNTRFFLVNEEEEITGELDAVSLGIREVMSNEFLAEQDEFQEKDNYPVPLYIRDDGSFLAEPWTWMNEDWLNRDIIREITFVWNGEEFQEESNAGLR